MGKNDFLTPKAVSRIFCCRILLSDFMLMCTLCYIPVAVSVCRCVLWHPAG